MVVGCTEEAVLGVAVTVAVESVAVVMAEVAKAAALAEEIQGADKGLRGMRRV